MQGEVITVFRGGDRHCRGGDDRHRAGDGDTDTMQEKVTEMLCRR